MKIAVVGLGYVGSTIAVLLSRQDDIFVLDINKERVDQINNKKSPIGDALMEEILKNENLKLTATTDSSEAFAGSDYIIIATNTNLDPETGMLNTGSIECVLDGIDKFQSKSIVDASDNSANSVTAPTIVIKSTVPTGYTRGLKSQYPQFSFLHCPEFLREKTAMEDVLNPSRIIVGWDGDEQDEQRAKEFANLILDCTDNSETPLLLTSTSESEAIKLFSNSYLALRISFFNELDTFAAKRGLDTSRIIKGVCLDPRIGDWYNVPGPGFGGNCLPKDTRQLIADFESTDVPELLINAALDENDIRKQSQLNNIPGCVR